MVSRVAEPYLARLRTTVIFDGWSDRGALSFAIALSLSLSPDPMQKNYFLCGSEHIPYKRHLVMTLRGISLIDANHVNPQSWSLTLTLGAHRLQYAMQVICHVDLLPRDEDFPRRTRITPSVREGIELWQSVQANRH